MTKSIVLPLVLAAVSMGVVAGFRPASAATAFSVAQLSALANAGFAYGLSADRSKIAGQAIVSGSMRAHVHSGGAWTNLGALAGFTHSTATDVNATGVAVGRATNQPAGYTPTDRAFVASGGTITMLPVLTGTGLTHAYGINDAGTIVGVSAGNKPFTYSGGVALTQLATPAGGAGSGAAHAINNAGDIVGWAGTATQRVPAMWDNGTAASFLAMPGGALDAEARIINGSGVVAGLAFYGPGNTRAFHYDANGNAVDMGTLGAAYGYSEAFDINSSRQAVGTSVLSSSPFTSAPFFYDNGTMVNLNTLLPANSGWVLQRALTINDLGEITGTGTLNGTPSGFKLAPIPEPAAVAGVAITGVLLALRRGRRS